LGHQRGDLLSSPNNLRNLGVSLLSQHGDPGVLGGDTSV